jgi:hypothetical protein
MAAYYAFVVDKGEISGWRWNINFSEHIHVQQTMDTTTAEKNPKIGRF